MAACAAAARRPLAVEPTCLTLPSHYHTRAPHALQNLLCMKIASEMGVAIAGPWLTWVKASIVPAAAGLMLTPLLMYKLFPPEIKDTPEAPKVRRRRRSCASRRRQAAVCSAPSQPVVCSASVAVLRLRPLRASTAAHPSLGARPRCSPTHWCFHPASALPAPAQLATQRLEKMGPMSRDEKIMLGTMGAAVCL